MSEYGMQGILDMNSIKQFTNPFERNLNSDSINCHEKHRKGLIFNNLNKNKDFKILIGIFHIITRHQRIFQNMFMSVKLCKHFQVKQLLKHTEVMLLIVWGLFIGAI